MASRIPFTTDEEQRVIAALATFRPRDRCLVVLGLNTGFRAAELGAIVVGDVWDGVEIRHELTLSRRFIKGGRGLHRRAVRSRSIPLNATARNAIGDFLRSTGIATDPSVPLFGSQRKGHALHRWQVNRIVHRAAQAAGLCDMRRIGCHSLRKTFCRKVYAASGHDIHATCAIMGHRHISTMESYLEVNAERLRSTVLAIG